jgi:hypothetical protein
VLPHGSQALIRLRGHVRLPTIWKLWPHFPDTEAELGKPSEKPIYGLWHAALTDSAFIARISTCRACAVKIDLADAADVVLG